MWTYEHSVETSADPAVVWRLYRDVSTWPRWNAAVERVELDGPFAAGTAGRLRPAGRVDGSLPFRLVAATENEGYTSETDIAETVTLRLVNTLAAAPGGGTRITHRAELVGPAAEYFGSTFGPALAAGVPTSVQALGELAALDSPRPGGAAGHGASTADTGASR
jgi:hypothetical protein